MLTNLFKNNVPILSMLLVFIIDLMLILTTHLNWNNAMSKYLPLKSQIQTFKSDISIGHLWFEEAISGDEYIDIEKDVMSKFRHEEFSVYINKSEELLSSKEDIKFYNKIKLINKKSKEFLALSKKRWQNNIAHGIGSSLDQEFDKRFNELVYLVDKLNLDIDERLSQEFKDRNKYFQYILVLFFFLNLIIFTVLYITRNKKIEFEKKLFEEKEKAETTLNSIGDAVISTDEKGNIEFLNPIAENLTGYSKEEARGKYLDEVFDIFNSSTKKKVESPVKKVLKKGIIVGLANGTALKSKDGTIYIIEDSAAPIKDKENKIIGTVLVFRDVTEQTKTKEQLSLNEKMLMQQSKLASMGEMLENIAHQWRQPLSTITVAASGMKLEKEFDILNDELFEKNVEAIIENSNKLSKTIDDFRDFFRPQGEKVLLNLDGIIVNALSIVSSKMNFYNIKVVKNCDEISLKSFASEFLQIFVTIINNSIEAFDDNSKKRYIFIDAKKLGKHIEIIVKDNAGGVSDDIIGRLFEPYFTTKHKSQGKGIGLFMVEEIITKHFNGSILVRNSEYYYKGKKYKGLETTIDIEVFK